MSTTYTFTYPIDPSPGDVVQSAFINNAGEVVGTYTDAAFATHGFTDIGGTIATVNDGTAATTDVTAVNDGGSFVGYGVNAGGTAVNWFVGTPAGNLTSFADPAGIQVEPVAVNAGGTVVGNYGSAGFIGNAANGVVSAITVAGAQTTTISAVNASGTIVGDETDANRVQHGFIDAGAVVTVVDPAGSIQTTINAINIGGEVAGTFQDSAGNVSGFTDTAGVITTFAVPGNLGLVVTGLNDAGAVAGYALGSSDLNEHGFVLSGGVLSTVTVPGSPNTEIFGINNSGTIVGVADDANGLEHGFTATPACYCPGTAIATPGGAVPVEALAIGDTVSTASGAARAVRWIGRRSYGQRFVAANPGLRPVRFQAGSLGAGLPHRDLLVSPNHAMFLDGLLIPARHLVNGSTIVTDRGTGPVHYLHVELDSHDVILAEGAAAESFVDDGGSRAMFHNAAEYPRLDEGRPAGRGFCAPRVESGEALQAVRNRLAGAPVGQAAAA